MSTLLLQPHVSELCGALAREWASQELTFQRLPRATPHNATSETAPWSCASLNIHVRNTESRSAWTNTKTRPEDTDRVASRGFLFTAAAQSCCQPPFSSNSKHAGARVKSRSRSLTTGSLWQSAAHTQLASVSSEIPKRHGCVADSGR